MGLNISKGNMYSFVTHTWNTVKGECYHGCSYCYMHRWGKQKPVHFDKKELRTDLGQGNFIFVGSSCDMWAKDIPEEWILKTLEYCDTFSDTEYLFQTKNPERIRRILPYKSSVCVTMESDIWYPEIMVNSPNVMQRSEQAKFIRHPLYITIEPILDFNLKDFIELIQICDPLQVNLGADSGNNNLPEPPKEKILEFIDELQKFTTIHSKNNLSRLLK